ncbi:MAG: MBOAT family protein [Lachnospiraceae bacterium]|nr:MBOAT family protein [Lachnospiraceae bacterium]
MLFSGIPFLYYFLPVVLLLYFIAPKCLKNTVLLIASLFFYAWGEPKIVLIMIASILAGYVSGLLIEAFRRKKTAKIVMIVSVVLQLGCLVYFKYMDFFIGNFNKVFGTEIPLLKIALPVGISFYTFQILSYTVDIYRGEKAQKNPINLATYIAMFPQLIAGPIVRYKDIASELPVRRFTTEDVASGIRRFVFGLAKKVLLANQLGELCDIFRMSQEKSVLFYWLYAVAFALHIYFDFSGYSDMAIGLGRIFGFHFVENFNYPFISGSVTEFWRRWHISLGSWFRDYVYIPLGGNRVPKWRWFMNIFIVWMLTGFWHGAAWNFIIWGLFFAVLLVFEKLCFLKVLEKHKILGHFYVILAVLISFVIFNASDMSGAFSDIGGMFGFAKVPFVTTETLYYLRSYAVILILALIGSTPFIKNTVVKLASKPGFGKCLVVAEPLILLALMLVMTAYLVDGSFNPFLYFRF